MGISAQVADSFGSTSPTLLDRAKANDPLAWQRLVELYSPLIFYWCRGTRLQAADAADIVQEVFHAVARSLERFEHETRRGSFRGWLRRITLNKLRDHWRAHGSEPAAAGGSAFHQQLLQAADPAAVFDPEAPPGAEETGLLLARALDLFRTDFEDSTWQAFWGLVIEGRSAGEMAAALGLTVNAVYKAKARVLSRLRSELHTLIDVRGVDRDA